MKPVVQPEWLRLPDAIRFSGLSRSYLYGLIAEGVLKSACIRKRGNTRGVRLISTADLTAFIERHIELRQERE
jgi:hypothetical protein